MKMKKIILIVSFCFLAFACKTKNEIEVTWDAKTNVDFLWQTIDTKYCFLEEKKVDWNAIHNEYLSLAEDLDPSQRDYDEQLFDLCAQMLNLLKDGHVNLYSWFDVSSYDGWYREAYPNFNLSLIFTKYVPSYRTASGLTYGYLSPEVTSQSIGYIYYSSFNNSCASLAGVLSKLSDAKVLIIDVRNNGGGDLSNAYTLAAPFFTEDKQVGYWQHKNGPEHDAFSPLESLMVKADTKVQWRRPVYVLTNRRCFSATNFFVSCMTQADKVTLVGDTTGGGGGLPMSYEMPCGWTVRFSTVKMYDVHQHSIEQGIAPAIRVDNTRSDVDDIIEKVIALTNN